MDAHPLFRYPAPRNEMPPPVSKPKHRTPAARRRVRVLAPLLPAVCLTNLAAAAPQDRAWWQMLPDKVVACGIAAVVLLLISLLLRGMLKVVTLLLVIVLAAGAFWFIRDGRGRAEETLPREWARLASETLDSPAARETWQAVQDEISHLSATARARLAAGTDDARRTLIARIEVGARKLDKEGRAADAAQLAKLALLLEDRK